MPLEIRLLGGVDVLADGEPLPLGGRKQRAVLAMLALRANRTVAADELIDGLWGDRPPRSAAKNVQLYVFRLRKALGQNGAGARIETHGRGYELEVPAEAVDALRFERLVERARQEAAEGITDGALARVPELWRGAPLADVAAEPFAAAEIRRLEELHRRAIELRIDAELAAGRHDEALGELASLIAAHPLNERFHAQRILALYRAGRQSEAMEAYREASRALIEAIGVGPGPELRELQEAILRQDPALAAPPPRAELPPQLEGGSPLLAGRERELRWLRKRWEAVQPDRCRLALLSGPPGIGKTRLAAELAAELRRRGVAVLYAAGSGAPDAAREAVREAAESERPTLIVLDDVDDAAPVLLESAAAATSEPRQSPLLILALHRGEQPPPPLAALEAAGAAQRLALRPLRVEAATEIAALYAPADGVAIPPQTLLAESEGVPLRVHRAASEWAHAQAAEELEVAVSDAATDQHGLRAARAKVAGGVAELQAARERASLYVVSEPPEPAAPEVCPFQGLAPFDAAHAAYFFGRERLVAALVARLVGSSLLAVLGPSGSGKSSAIRAGLLPSLAEGVLPGSEHWRRVVMRPGAHPLAELRRALARASGGPGAAEADGEDPLGALEALSADERLVLAADQLEEIFTACRDEAERATFCAALAAAATDPDHRVVVVLGIRADFYGRCADYPELAERMSANNVLVGPMRRDELRRAIELPARKADLRVEPALTAALVGEVAEEPGGLPLLSTTLVELWEARSGRTLRRAAYQQSGGVSGAVARLAERAYRRLTAPQRQRARAILLRLADAEAPAPVRRRVALAELETDRDADAAAALTVLTESRLVTVDEGAVEVAHEALLSEWPRLRDWLAADAAGRRLHQHLARAAAEWERSGREAAELYRGARLAAALDWAEGHDPELNALERDFLAGSRAESEREAERQRRTNRRLTALLAGVGVLLVLAAVAGLIARSQRQEARSAATVADAQRLGAEALSADRVEEAILLANTGAALDDSLATRSSLLAALSRSPALQGVLRANDGLYPLALSPDGSTLAVGTATGTVTLFDAATRERIGDYEVEGELAGGWVTGLAFDPDGTSLAAGIEEASEGREAELHIIDSATQRLRTSTWLGEHPSAPGTPYLPFITYAPDGESVIVKYQPDAERAPVMLRRFGADTGSPEGEAARIASRPGPWPLMASSSGRLVHASENATQVIDPETLRVVRRHPVGGGESAALSADGGTVALGGENGRVRLLDLGSGRAWEMSGGHDSSVTSAAFSPDGRALATAGDDGTVIVWDAERGTPVESLHGHSGEVFGQAFSPDGRTLYTASRDSTVIVWDVSGDRRLGRPFRTGVRESRCRAGDEPCSGFPPAFAVSPEGDAIAVARPDGRVDLIDAETLRRIGGFKAFHRTPAAAIDYSPDGASVAVAGGRGLLGVWDAESGQPVGPLLNAPRGGRCAQPESMVDHENQQCSEATVQHALVFGPQGVLAVASLGGDVRVWDLEERKPIGPPVRVPRYALGADFSPDGSRLAIPFGFHNPQAPAGPGVEIRDVESGERVASLPVETEPRAVSFSPDGELLAVGGTDGAQLWATDEWRRAGPRLAVGEGQWVIWVEFSPDGRTLAISHDDGTISLWDVESQAPAGSLRRATNTWVTARFTPDGGRLFGLHDRGRAVRWELDPAAWRQHACAVAGSPTPERWEEIVPEQDYVSVCPTG